MSEGKVASKQSKGGASKVARQVRQVKGGEVQQSFGALLVLFRCQSRPSTSNIANDPQFLLQICLPIG